MRAANALTQQFAREHPADAARVLEPFPAEMATALLQALGPALAARVLEHMLQGPAADCMARLPANEAATVLGKMSPAAAARVLRITGKRLSDGLLGLSPAPVRRAIQQRLRYPKRSVGALMRPDVLLLRDELTVSDAIKRLESADERAVACELYVVNGERRLAGVLGATDLFATDRRESVRSLMSRDVPTLSTQATLAAVESLPAWSRLRTLPVTDAEQLVVGVLHYRDVQEALATQQDARRDQDVAGSLHLAEQGWIGLAALLELILDALLRGTRQP